MSQGSALRPGGAPLGERALVAGGLAFELAKKWWVLLLRGILLIIVGLLAFVSPVTWVIFVGVYMLFDGMSLLLVRLQRSARRAEPLAVAHHRRARATGRADHPVEPGAWRHHR